MENDVTVDEIRKDREARESAAFFIAAPLPLVDYYADNNDVRRIDTRESVYTADSHWGACLVMMAAHSRNVDDHADAYGRTGEQMDCGCCGKTGIEYDETCVTCGGFGWVRA